MTVRPVNIRFEHHPTGFGIGRSAPRISWQLANDESAFEQTAYEVELAGVRGGGPVRVESNAQVLVPWPFAPLGSRERATVRVRVGSGGRWSDWSEVAEVEAGLLDPSDWTAGFVTPTKVGGLGSPVPLVRGEFAVRGPVARARLYTTALGVYEARLNGQPVGDEILAPGWTTYPKRLCYQSFDVTPLLVQGTNTFDAILGNGWYRGQLTWLKRRAVYGDRLAVIQVVF